MFAARTTAAHRNTALRALACASPDNQRLPLHDIAAGEQGSTGGALRLPEGAAGAVPMNAFACGGSLTLRAARRSRRAPARASASRGPSAGGGAKGLPSSAGRAVGCWCSGPRSEQSWRARRGLPDPAFTTCASQTPAAHTPHGPRHAPFSDTKLELAAGLTQRSPFHGRHPPSAGNCSSALLPGLVTRRSSRLRGVRPNNAALARQHPRLPIRNRSRPRSRCPGRARRVWWGM